MNKKFVCWCSFPVNPPSQAEWQEWLSESDRLQLWWWSVYQPQWIRCHTDWPGRYGPGKVVSVRELHHGNHSDNKVLVYTEVGHAHYWHELFFLCISVFLVIFVPITQTIHPRNSSNQRPQDEQENISFHTVLTWHWPVWITWVIKHPWELHSWD